MNRCIRNTRQNSYILLLSGIIFLLYFILAPLSYDRISTSVNGSPNYIPNKQTPINQSKTASFLMMVFVENELLTEVVTYNVINRTIQECRQQLNRMINMLTVLVTGIGILLHFRRCFIREADRKISVLAISKGGHAPPQICIN